MTSGTRRRSFASSDFPTIADRLSSRLASPSSDDSVFDHVLREIPCVHFSQHSLEFIRREYVPQHIEDLSRAAGIQIALDLFDPLEQFLENSTLACVRANEVSDEAILLLEVAVDSPHPLFQMIGVPGNVVVDHVPAELQVDALTRRFGRHQDLA